MSTTIITSLGDNLNSMFDKRFGRAEFFCVFDNESKESSFVKNEFASNNQAAGTKAAELMIELKAEKIISGDFGPKAKELLDKLNIQMVMIEDSSSIGEIIERINK